MPKLSMACSTAVPKCSLSKYGFQASGVRTTPNADRAETGRLPRFLSSVLNRPSHQVRREWASGERFQPAPTSGQSTGPPRKPPGNLPLSAALGLAESAARMGTGGSSGIRNLGVRPHFSAPVPFPQASISPTHAASQHNKTHVDQRVKPCWKNRPTLKLWRESPESERKSPNIPPPHHQGFWRKARKYTGISKPNQG
jgi:hypothetical protein